MNDDVTIAAKLPSSTGDWQPSKPIAAGKARVSAAKVRKVQGTPANSVAKAVYAHIRALRTLGHDTVNTVDIASALGVSVREVEASISELESKGVKLRAGR